MNASYVWSKFCLRIPIQNGILLKSTLTGAVVVTDAEVVGDIERVIAHELSPSEVPEFAEFVGPDIGLIVDASRNEFKEWSDSLLTRRNDEAHIFILHFIPTIQCQLKCNYCIENGADRGKPMKMDILTQSVQWVTQYLASHPEIDHFRLVLFGGEPLLQKDLIRNALREFHQIANERHIGFSTEMVSNGEFLDEPTAAMLSAHNWTRVQITLDGPQEVHDSRRHGANGRPTFLKIVENIKMLLRTDYIRKVDVRISLDVSNADRVIELIEELAGFPNRDNINLSLGLITPTIANPERVIEHEELVAEKALAAWKRAKELGFEIPDTFVTGPWCVAVAKHGAVLQPDGGLQKCFCTAGRKEYDFGTISAPVAASSYLKDPRYEQFKRTEECIAEQCPFLPVCGGGCIHNAMVEHGGGAGGKKRFCQKTLLEKMNIGLLHLSLLTVDEHVQV